MYKDKKKTIAVVGASGFLGSYLYKDLSFSFTKKYSIVGTIRRKDSSFFNLNVMNPKEIDVFLHAVEPDVIIFCAGTKDVGRCEEKYSFAYENNIFPIEIFVEKIKKINRNTKFIFISSDYVFDGEKGMYEEYDERNPKTNYGKSKKIAEDILFASDNNVQIVRTAAVMGKGGNFFDFVCSSIDNAKTIELFDDRYFSPTPINFFSEAIKFLIDNKTQRIIHLVGEKRMSRYDFGVLIEKIKKVQTTHIVPIKTKLHILQQHDSSLKQSLCIEKWQQQFFEDYTKKLL